MPAELTQAIPVIATDAPAARHRRPCIPPSPLHVAGDVDLTTPPVARVVGAEAYRREVDARALPLADAHAALYGEGAAQAAAIDAQHDRTARDGRRLTIRAAMIRALDLSGCDATRAADCADQALREFVARKQL